MNANAILYQPDHVQQIKYLIRTYANMYAETSNHQVDVMPVARVSSGNGTKINAIACVLDQLE